MTTTAALRLNDADDARVDDNKLSCLLPRPGGRRVQARRNGASRKRTETRTHAHARSGGVVLLARVATTTGLRLRSTPALGPARHRSARLDPTRFDSARLRATPRDADDALSRARDRKRERTWEGAGGEKRVDAERVNHHRLERASRGGGTREPESRSG